MEVPKTLLMAAIPLVLLHLSLMLYTLRLLYRERKTRMGSVGLWVVLIILVNTFGSLAYLLWGRSHEAD